MIGMVADYPFHVVSRGISDECPPFTVEPVARALTAKCTSKLSTVVSSKPESTDSQWQRFESAPIPVTSDQNCPSGVFAVGGCENRKDFLRARFCCDNCFYELDALVLVVIGFSVSGRRVGLVKAAVPHKPRDGQSLRLGEVIDLKKNYLSAFATRTSKPSASTIVIPGSYCAMRNESPRAVC